MERCDLRGANAAIFRTQGQALNKVASRDVKVLVAGNPANTNAWVTRQFTSDLPDDAITAMFRLDHIRAVGRLAAHCGVPTDKIHRIAVWGNHSLTMYADYRHALARRDSIRALLSDEAWHRNVFIPDIARRGTTVIETRGASCRTANAAFLVVSFSACPLFAKTAASTLFPTSISRHPHVRPSMHRSLNSWTK
jgi:malate dehydrogenase